MTTTASSPVIGVRKSSPQKKPARAVQKPGLPCGLIALIDKTIFHVQFLCWFVVNGDVHIQIRYSWKKSKVSGHTHKYISSSKNTCMNPLEMYMNIKLSSNSFEFIKPSWNRPNVTSTVS